MQNKVVTEALNDKLSKTNGGVINGSLSIYGNCDFNGRKLYNVGTPTSSNQGANKQYVDNLFSAFDYNTVTLLDTTLAQAVSSIKINQYNNADFRCREYCVLLEIPRTGYGEIEILNTTAQDSSGGTTKTINIRPIKTTTQSNKKILAIIKYKQNSKIYWTSESGSLVTNTSGSGSTWTDNYAAVQTYPMAGSASGLDATGVGSIILSGVNGTFPVGTKITVWGDIKQ